MKNDPSIQSKPFGLLAWLGQTRVHLPLTHIETRFRVTGEVVTVQIDQVFEQNAREALDVTYTFPLPGSAAVHRCEMIVNDRVIRAVVMEEQEARRVVAEKKAAGHRTALVEMERENLFTLQLGNVNPGDRIVIRFAYIEQLDRLGTQLSLRIPFSPGIRYIPGKPLLRANRGKGSVDDTDQVPDASRLTPPRISGDHPDAATLYLEGLFDADDVELRTLSSPTHPSIFRNIAGRIEVELAGDQHLPDRDFVLRWEEITAAEPVTRSWSCAHDGNGYALLQLRAPQTAAVAASDDFAQDIYFLLDRSSSMEGVKWKKCAEALHAFVRELGARDRVWITCFESRYQDFDAALLERDAILADAGFQNLASIGTDGGTELLPALEHVLKVRQSHGADRPARLILITDGQVGNESAILTRMRQADAAALPMHCFGIDDAVNDAFLKSLARQTGGRCALLTPDDDIPAAVRRLAVTLRRPVLTNLVLTGEHQTTDDTPKLPDLHAGEVTLLALRVATGAQEATITARLTDGTPWLQRFILQEDADSQSPRLLWAQRRTRHLLEVRKPQAAVNLAIAHNLVCQGASFVAWDEVEKVSVAKREVYQPAPDIQAASLAGEDIDDLKVMRRMSFSRAPVVDSPITKLFAAKVYKKASLTLPDAPAGRIFARMAVDDLADDRAVISPRLRTWERQFQSCLRSAGLSCDEAVRLSNLLHAWAGEIISHSREALLLAWVNTLNASVTPLEELRQFILTNVTGPALQDLKRLLDEVLLPSPAQRVQRFISRFIDDLDALRRRHGRV